MTQQSAAVIGHMTFGFSDWPRIAVYCVKTEPVHNVMSHHKRAYTVLWEKLRNFFGECKNVCSVCGALHNFALLVAGNWALVSDEYLLEVWSKACINRREDS